MEIDSGRQHLVQCGARRGGRQVQACVTGQVAVRDGVAHGHNLALTLVP